ncbi:MAG: ATP-dependent helicase, partial [Deltaproteobacteria bacterium]
VVDHVLGNRCTVVSAGAGSGKTYTTVATVLELIDHGKASAEDFALITFTHKAASELRQRIRKGLRERFLRADRGERSRWHAQMERLGGAYVGTIHGFCAELLRRYGFDQAIARQSSITLSDRLREEVEKEVLEGWSESPQLMGRAGLLQPFELRKLVDQVLEAMRNVGLDPADVLAATMAGPDDHGKPYRVAVAKIIAHVNERYAEEKQSKQLLDAHDILVRAADMLRAEPDVAKSIAERRPYVFVDEFQDTDRTQKRLVDALLPHCRGVLVVGDAKQSIYRFRGADVSLIMEIAREQGVATLPLDVSRRPTRPLLAAQNALFESVGGRYPSLHRPLRASAATMDPSQGPTAFRYLSAGGGRADQSDRINIVCRAVQGMLGKKIERGHSEARRVENIQLGHIVVLVRSNHDVAAYTAGLVERGIAARSDRGVTFFELPEIVGAYRLLRMILDYPAAAPLAEALMVPYLRQYWEPALESGLLAGGGGALHERVESTHPEFARNVRDVRDHLRVDTVSQSLRRAYQVFGVTAHYQEHGDSLALLNLERLRDVARGMFSEEQALTMRQFVEALGNSVRTGRELDFAELHEAERPEHVRVMTIHAAKGLEFPIVIIPEVQRPLTAGPPPLFSVGAGGLDVQVFPEDGVRDSRTARFFADQPARRRHELDEAIRLLYVAVTRATHSVVLVGSGRTEPQEADSPYYAWLDEVLRARPALEALGARVARFWFAPSSNG